MAVSENSSIKDLRNECKNCNHFVNDILMDYIGIPIDELIRKKAKEESDGKENPTR